MHVLIVDDDPWQVDHFRQQLEQSNFKVSSAANAVAAIKYVDNNQPDVLVLDMMIPGPNGMTLLHELQSHSDLASIPVVVCSSLQLSLADLKSYGVVAVLDKTKLTQSDLVAAVKKAK